MNHIKSKMQRFACQKSARSNDMHKRLLELIDNNTEIQKSPGKL
ncbi:hypothetical protein [Methanolapillus ohkumae]